MRYFIQGALMLGALLALFGCSPTLVGKGPLDLDAKDSGIRYYVGKDVALVEVTITEFEEQFIDSTLSKKARTGRENVQVALSLKTVPDVRKTYLLDLQPGGTKDQTLAVQVGPTGLLSSINIDSVDRTGEIVVNVAKATASVAGAFFGFAKADNDTVLDRFKETNLVLLPDGQQKKALRRFQALPNEVLFFTSAEFPQARVFVEDLTRAQVALDDARDAYLAAVAEVPTSTPPETAQKKADAQSKLVAALEARVADLSKALAAAVDQLKVSNQIARKTCTRKTSYILELDELPSINDVTPANLKPNSKALYDDTRVIVTYDRAWTPATADTGHAPGDQGKADKAMLFYREARPAQFRIISDVLALDGGATKLGSVPKILEARDVPVLDEKILPTRLVFDSTAFSTQKLQVAFDDQGRLKGVTQGASSPIAGAAGALTNAVSGARDEFVASLSKAKDVIATKQAIDVSYLQAAADTLAKRKSILDNELALQGAHTNYATALEKQQVDAELALLQQQLALTKAQDTSAASIQQAKTTADVDILKAQVEMLKQRIELLHQQALLRDAQQPSTAQH